MNFQTSKRIMCCLMAALILCTAVVRPIEASATGFVETLAGATVVGINPGVAIAGILAALGVGYMASTSSARYEDLIFTISNSLPTEFILETMSGEEMIEAYLYNDVAYVSREVVDWINNYLYAPGDGTPRALSASDYTFSADYQDLYESVIASNPEYLSYADSARYAYS